MLALQTESNPIYSSKSSIIWEQKLGSIMPLPLRFIKPTSWPASLGLHDSHSRFSALTNWKYLIHVSQHYFVSRFANHHEYFDGYDREFRGFAFVEQRDSEKC